MNGYQKGFYTIEKILDHSSVNKLSCLVRFYDDIDVSVLEKVLMETAKSTYILKKIDSYGDIVTDESFFNTIYEIHDFSDETEFYDYVSIRKSEPIHLQNSQLIGFEILTLNGNVSLFCWFHHIMYDGISMNLLIDNIINNYYAMLNNKEISILVDGEADFADIEKKYIASQRYLNDRLFWQEKTQVLEKSDTTFCRDITALEADRLFTFIDINLAEDIRSFCKSLRISEATFFTAISILLVKPYFTSKYISLGISLHNRTHSQRNKLCMIMNTLPLIIEPDRAMDFKALFKAVSYKMSEVMRYRNFPQNEIPYFPQVLFSYQVNKFKSYIDKFECKWLYSNQTTIPLAISVTDFDRTGGFHVALDYRLADFSASHVKFLSKKFVELCKIALSSFDNQPVFSVLTDSEKKIYEQLNHTNAPYPTEKTVVDIFLETSRDAKNKLAIIFNNEKATFAELDFQSNKVAYFLLNTGVQSGDKVALLFDKSLEMVFAIWGIIKAGAAYVPIDPQWPEERKEMIYSIIKPRFIITNIKHQNSKDVDIIGYDEIPDTEKAITPKISAHDPLYVIFTSGTTGIPKGVCVSHRNIVNLAYDNRYYISHNDIVLQIINYTFDVSVVGYIVALMKGATVVIAADDVVLDPRLTAKLVKDKGISMLNTTTALLNQWIPFIDQFSNVKYIMTGGEKLTPSTANVVFRKLGSKLINGYGPTETTVFSTIYIIDKLHSSDMPIGTPINNTTVYVLDSDGNAASINQIGELCIGGDGVSLGYINNAKETGDYFIKTSFSDGKIYKTGDLCFVSEQGLIVFCGRKDTQIKIRGHRVELSEIENALHSTKGIIASVVIVEHNRIIAYVVKEDTINITEINDMLSKKLPRYMIPSRYRIISEIPLTRNGKVDSNRINDYVISSSDSHNSDDNISIEEEQIKDVFQRVLSIDDIGVSDSFFAMGGSSLDAMKAVTDINEKFQSSISVAEFYKNDTIESISTLVDSSEYHDYKAETNKIEGNTAPVTPSQSMIYSIWNMNRNSTSYNIPVLIKLVTNINVNKLEWCLTNLIERHEVLRSKIVIDSNGEMLQTVDSSFKFRLKTHIISSMDFSKFITPFNLNEGHPFHAVLLKHFTGKYLFLDFHHSFVDGTSIMIFLKELDALYLGYEIETSFFRYINYVNYLANHRNTKSEEFWKAYVADSIPANIDARINRNKKSNATGITEYQLSSTIANGLFDAVKDRSYSLQNYLLACFTLLLTKYNNEGKVAIGTALSGRTSTDFETSMGMYVNTVPLIFDADKERTISEHINSVIENISRIYDHQTFGFNNIVRVSNVPRDSARNPIFDIMFIIQNTNLESQIGKVCANNSLQIEEKFDLTLEVKVLDGNVAFKVTYKKALFADLTIRLLLKRFEKVIENSIVDSNIKIKELSIITDIDSRLLEEFNSIDCKYPHKISVVECIIKAAQKYKNKKAVFKENNYITYNELYDNARKIAGVLQESGIGRNSIIGLYCVRSIEMIEAIWGIILSGAAYMPIEIGIPSSRINYMLCEGNVDFVVTFGTDNSVLPERCSKIDISEIKKISEDIWYKNPHNKPQDLLYVMFTSGSTGNPKGVQVEHKNVIEFVFGMGKIESKRFLSVSNYAFDGSIYDIFTPLLTGGSVTVLDKSEAMDPSFIAQVVLDRKIHSMFLPAALFNMFTDDDLEKLKSIHRLYIGGEKLSPSHVKRGLRYLQDKLYNGYGPTEATVFSVTHKIDISDTDGDIPIGKPFNSTKIYILDDEHKPCPIGINGNIFIAGDGVSRGYLNSSELMKDKFSNNVIDGELTYDSGDIGRWSVMGHVEYSGRKDNQTKFRGFRIELDEIRQKMLSLTNVEDAEVLVVERNGNKELNAYFVVTNSTITIQDMDNYLKELLPEYMIPRFYGIVEHIPLTQNGKVDRIKLKTLPVSSVTTHTYEPPKTDYEKRIAGIWQELFNIENVSRDDDFFALGGHSIQAIRFISEMKKDGIELNVKDVMDNSKLMSLAKYIEQMQYGQLKTVVTSNSSIFQIESHGSFKRLNNNSEENAVFVFPTYMLNIAYAITFSKMADAIKSHSFYLGTFTNSKNYVQEFAKDLIKKSKKYSNIWLLGYSFGGSLAYEVAKIIADKGVRIKGIILIDSFFKENADNGYDSFIEDIKEPGKLRSYLEERFDFYRDLDTSLKDNIENCFFDFFKYTRNLENKKKILNTDIYYLRAEHQDLDVQDTRDMWKVGCSTSYIEYLAHGKHNDMLDFNNLGKNVRIINGILISPESFSFTDDSVKIQTDYKEK